MTVGLSSTTTVLTNGCSSSDITKKSMTLPLPVESRHVGVSLLGAAIRARTAWRHPGCSSTYPARLKSLPTTKGKSIARRTWPNVFKKCTVLLGIADCRRELRADHDHSARQNSIDQLQLHAVLRRPLHGSVQVSNVRGLDARSACSAAARGAFRPLALKSGRQCHIPPFLANL